MMYHLPMKQISDAFTAVNIPQGQQLNLFKTCVLDVDLVRQEIVDGKPSGEETVVKKLEISATPPFPNGIAEELQYVGWATANQGQIIQPGFFQIARGDPWLPPGVDLAMQNGMQQPVNLAFDPSKPYSPAELRQLTPEQFALVKAYRQQQAEMRRQNRASKIGSKAPTRGGATPEDMGMEGISPEVPDLSRLQVAQLYPGQPVPPDYEPGMEDPAMMEGQMGQQQQQFQMAPATFAQFPLPPAGEFDPRMAPEPTVGWAHDDTVQPGKSYRYKVRYKIKNPVFQIFNITQPKSLSNVFAITSPDSNWSEPVNIPPLTRLFCRDHQPEQLGAPRNLPLAGRPVALGQGELWPGRHHPVQGSDRCRFFNRLDAGRCSDRSKHQPAVRGRRRPDRQAGAAGLQVRQQ